MFKVKVTFPYPQWDLLRQTPQSSGVWGNYKFHINEDIESYDYWFVFNHLLLDKEFANCPRENIVLLTGEPFEISQYEQSFLNQFAHIITCQREIKHKSVTYLHQGHPWFVGANYKNGSYSDFTKSYDELINLKTIKKTKKLSIITSDKLFTEGHRKRYEFAMALKDYFGEDIDLFGRGVKDFSDKWDVLKDYKYSIAIENASIDDWMTEKIYDCFCAHTFPIYYGCPNLNKYFSEDAFSRIDIDDIEGSKKLIEKLLTDTNHYETSLSSIINAKNHYLNNYNFFPLIVNFIESKLSNKTKSVKTTLRATIPQPFLYRIAGKIKRSLK
ncbi:Glycosyltransferase family 10 (fucosyltransferase) [compost metagenome]